MIGRQMRTALLILGIAWSGAAAAVECDGDPDSSTLSFVDRACSRLVHTWKNGNHEIMLSGFQWHLPYSYEPAKRAELNENAWGGGYARTVEEAGGNTHTVYFLAFLDSHENVQNNLGYAWSTYWGPRDGPQPGLGYTVFIVQRPDIASGFPVPAVLPTASLRMGPFTLVSSFIPKLNGGVNHGSVLYVFGRYTLK
jgi:palmitoyl transferase